MKPAKKKPADSTLPKFPKGLSAEAKGWWSKIVSEWALDDMGLLVLEQALEAFDRMRQAQAILKTEGMVIKDRFGQKKSHPMLLTERDAKTTMLRALKQLALDIKAPSN